MMKMAFTLFYINVFVLLFVNIVYSYPRLKTSSFNRVFNVSLSEYINDVLFENVTVSSHHGCIATCNDECFSVVYDSVTTECKTYSKELTTGGNETQALKVYVKTLVTVSEPAGCSDVNPANNSGIYRIEPILGSTYDVYCDMDTENGPWTVIQNRQDGQVDFFRNWTEYKNGFGDLNGNFWLGLDMIHLLTKKKSILRIQLESWFGDVEYAQYSSFSIADEVEKYTLYISGFSGNVFCK